MPPLRPAAVLALAPLVLLVAPASAESACGAGCGPRGYCNEDEAQCVCQYGWEGTPCAPVHTACWPDPAIVPEASPNEDFLIDKGVLLPCECLRQLEGTHNGKGPLGHPDRNMQPKLRDGLMCLHPDVNAAAATGLPAPQPANFTNPELDKILGGSREPPPADSGVAAFCWNKYRDQGVKAEKLSWSDVFSTSKDPRPCHHGAPKPDALLAPPSACPKSCSGNGYCKRRGNGPDAECVCMPGSTGGDCSGGECTADANMCINSCSGNGDCHGRFCRCHEGWFGIDCSMQKRVGPPKAAPSTKQLKVFVYDLPGWVSRSKPCNFGRCSAHCGDWIYSSNIFFLQQLLRDSRVLTHDPEEATLFYAPLMPYAYSGNVGSPVGHLMATKDWVEKAYPYYGRRGGKDHIWWVVGDRHTCQVPKEMRSGVIVGHWGNHWGKYGEGPQACVDIWKDVVAPPLSPMSVGGSRGVGTHQIKAANDAREVYGSGYPDAVANPGKRHVIAFFAGSMGFDRDKHAGKDNPCFWVKPGNDFDNDHCRDLYGQGVRSALYNEYGTRKDWNIHLHGYGHGEYTDRIRSAKFCVDAAGHGFSTRIVDYVANGCIPVVVATNVSWPFQHDIPYSEFGLHFNKADIPKIAGVLEGHTPEMLAEKQEGLKRWHKRLLWDPEYGEAYQQALEALAVRAKRQGLLEEATIGDAKVVEAAAEEKEEAKEEEKEEEKEEAKEEEQLPAKETLPGEPTPPDEEAKAGGEPAPAEDGPAEAPAAPAYGTSGLVPADYDYDTNGGWDEYGDYEYVEDDDIIPEDDDLEAVDDYELDYMLTDYMELGPQAPIPRRTGERGGRLVHRTTRVKRQVHVVVEPGQSWVTAAGVLKVGALAAALGLFVLYHRRRASPRRRS